MLSHALFSGGEGCLKDYKPARCSNLSSFMASRLFYCRKMLHTTREATLHGLWWNQGKTYLGQLTRFISF